MNKSKALFWIFFTILFFIHFYIFLFIADRFLFWGTNFANIFFVFIFVIVVIPTTAFVAEWTTKFSMRIGLKKKKNFIIFVSSLVILTASVLTITTYNDYREKGLNEVIQFNKNNWEYIILGHDLRLDKEAHYAFGESLEALLEQYTVKKMPDRDWNPDVSKENGFNFTVYDNDNVIIASIYEHRINFLNDGNYYEVLDGPINMNWLDKMHEEGIGEKLAAFE
ncbi:hypothetical protein [Oceanobacillus sp. CAU 1775]